MSKEYRRNEYIRKRRRKRAIKKSIIILILLLAILSILCLKLSFFDIKQIQVNNNKNVSKDEIIKLSNIKTGSNIFYQNFRKSKNGLKKNPYILDVSFKRKLPDEIEINVTERKAKFYAHVGSKFAVIDKGSTVIEIRDSIADMNLIRIDGIDQSKIVIGKTVVPSKDIKTKFINDISELVDRSNKNVPKMTEIDITDSKGFNVSYSDMVVKLGDMYGIENKLNKAINILLSQGLKSAKGYIDVSFNGNPVVNIQR